MNVRVNLSTPIYDGMEVVFKAPCDADQVTGLILYYPKGTEEVSSVFAFADAQTNDLGNIDNLFFAGAVVKVILDTETNRAFVQNAATNAYLEGRFENMGDSNVLKVYATSRDTASHNSTEVHGHLEKGGYALFTYGEYIYICVSASYAESTFIATAEETETIRIIKLYGDGKFETFVSSHGSAEGAVLIDQGIEKAGTLLYVGADGKVTSVTVGDGVEVNYGHGKNIAAGEWVGGYWSPTGWKETQINNCGIDKKVPVIPGETYTASITALGNIATSYVTMYVYEHDENGNYLIENLQVKSKALKPTAPITFSVGVNTAYIGVRLYASGYSYSDIIPEGFMIEHGSTATEYEPYTEGYTMTVQEQVANGITDVAYAEHAPSATVRSIAHRGVTDIAPDCTAPAYILARKAGFTVAENDVQCTSDGKYVMWHDTTLAKCTKVYSLDGKILEADADGNRYWVSAGNVYAYDESTGEYTLTDVNVSTLSLVSGSALTVAQQTYGFLRNIDVGSWKSGKFTGTQMMSFDEWIDLCKALGMECYVDSKFTYTVEQAAELVAIVRKKGMLRKCSWLASSLADGTPLANIRLADPKARCGILYAPTENKFAENGVFDLALKSGGEGSVFWNPQNTEVTAENAGMALAHGYGYECWYVNTASLSTDVYYAEIERLLQCGCQGLTLDDHTVENFTAYKYGNAMKNY